MTLLLHVEHVTINQPKLILLLDSLQFYRNFRRQPGLTWLYEQCRPSEEIFWKDFHRWLIHMWICVTFSFSRECSLILFINFYLLLLLLFFLYCIRLSPEVLHAFTEQPISFCVCISEKGKLKTLKETLVGTTKVEDCDHL